MFKLHSVRVMKRLSCDLPGSPERYPVITAGKCPNVSSKISSGLSLTNVETSCRTAVSRLASFSPSLASFSPYVSCHVWREGCQAREVDMICLKMPNSPRGLQRRESQKQQLIDQTSLFSVSKAWCTHTVPEHNICINPQLKIVPSTCTSPSVWITSVKNYSGQLLFKKVTNPSNY